MKPSYLPLITSPKVNKISSLRVLSQKNSKYDDDDDNSQKSSNNISNKSRMSIYLGN